MRFVYAILGLVLLAILLVVGLRFADNSNAKNGGASGGSGRSSDGSGKNQGKGKGKGKGTTEAAGTRNFWDFAYDTLTSASQTHNAWKFATEVFT